MWNGFMLIGFFSEFTIYVTINVVVCQPGNRSVYASGPNVYPLNNALAKRHLATEGLVQPPFPGCYCNAAMHQSHI